MRARRTALPCSDPSVPAAYTSTAIRPSRRDRRPRRSAHPDDSDTHSGGRRSRRYADRITRLAASTKAASMLEPPRTPTAAGAAVTNARSVTRGGGATPPRPCMQTSGPQPSSTARSSCMSLRSAPARRAAAAACPLPSRGERQVAVITERSDTARGHARGLGLASWASGHPSGGLVRTTAREGRTTPSRSMARSCASGSAPTT